MKIIANYMTENIFQGKRNYTSSDNKLQMNSLPDKMHVEDDFVPPQIRAGSLPNQKHLPSFHIPPQPPWCVAADDAQSNVVVVVSQKVSAQQSEEGLIFPLGLNVCQACDPSSNSPSLLCKSDTYDKTVYFEVSFSP